MITVKLTYDAFDRNGFAILGRVADAVLIAMRVGTVTTHGERGRAWQLKAALVPSETELEHIKAVRIIDTSTREHFDFEAERNLWKRIDAAVQAGILSPVDSKSHKRRERGDLYDAVVPFEQLNLWGTTNGLYEFSRESQTPIADALPVVPNENLDEPLTVITTHQLNKRQTILDHVIAQAKKNAADGNSSQSVWAELVKMAEQDKKPTPLIGYSPEGIQYSGKKYQVSGEPDVLTLKNLRDRMARKKRS